VAGLTFYFLLLVVFNIYHHDLNLTLKAFLSVRNLYKDLRLLSIRAILGS
jgi:hypothetical protein